MNAELKAMIQLVLDLVVVVEDAVAKKDFVSDLLPKIYKVMTDVPAVAAHFNDLMPEVNALLNNTGNDADLISFILSQLSGVTSDAHAQKIISASVDMALCLGQKAVVLQQAIKG